MPNLRSRSEETKKINVPEAIILNGTKHLLSNIFCSGLHVSECKTGTKNERARPNANTYRVTSTKKTRKTINFASEDHVERVKKMS